MYVTARQGLEQAPMLGQHSLKHLPDWMRLYLNNVDANYRSYTWLFFIFLAHPTPHSVSTLRSLGDKIAFDLRGVPLFWWGELREELNRIRVRRQMEDKDFARLLSKYFRLFQEVDKRFKTFKREDLKPFLIEVLLASGRIKNVPGSDPKNWAGPFLHTGGPSLNLGKRFVREKLPPELSKRLTESPWYVQEVIYAHLARSLWVMANAFQFENAAFRKEVEREEKARTTRVIEKTKSE
ncbi:MAG: hypothetical protein H8K07_07735 [Nitrospira sp.]|jgi:hypothetical protein|nr:hypothetical protein [Nitrospira sp.]MDI3463393.1 hypothetical protein [Nitrospira sp.]